LTDAVEEVLLGGRPADHVQHGVEEEEVVVPGQDAVEGVVPDGREVGGAAHSDLVRVLAGEEEVVAVEVDELDAEAIDDGADVRIPLGEDVIAVFDELAIFEVGSGLAAEAMGALEDGHAPAAKDELAGDGHAGEAAADDDSG
jgi:hypothetical protein